jgi:hypothetical protein
VENNVSKDMKHMTKQCFKNIHSSYSKEDLEEGVAES